MTVLPLTFTIKNAEVTLDVPKTEEMASLNFGVIQQVYNGNGTGAGENGATFTPNLSEDGTLSWTNDKNLPNPAPVNIKGTPGDVGATPNLTIGTVTTLKAGSDAKATITGTPENPVLNLSIPRGADGKDGVGGGTAGGNGETSTVISANLFDKEIAIPGKMVYASSSGPQLRDSTDMYAAYVPLRGAGVYRTKVSEAIRGADYASRVPILKEDKTFIKNVIGTLTATDNRNAYDLEFTITQELVDAGAAIYVFDCHASIFDTVMIVKDMEYPTEYIPFGYINVGGDVETDEDVDDGKLDNVLYEKTAVFLGDSLCAGDIEGSEYDGWGWAGLIGEANCMTWKNYGRNGGTITPIASVAAESRDLNSQVNIAKAEHPGADFVIFEGGSNDAYQLKDAGLGVISDDFYTFDTSTFSGAMESLIRKIMDAFPNAQVGYIVAPKMGTPPYTNDRNIQRKYFDRAVEICQKWGVPVIDLWNGAHLIPALLYHAQNFYTDMQHLTLAGYQRISPQIEAWMRNMTVPGVVSGGSIGGSSAPADWNATEGEVGHVLNRTHWSRIEETVFINNVTVEDVGAEIFTPPLVAGQKYTVVWNGVEFNDVGLAFEGNGMSIVALGNGGMLGIPDHNPDHPYSVLYLQGLCLVTNYVDSDPATITLTGMSETVKKLDKKYLPDLGSFNVDTMTSGRPGSSDFTIYVTTPVSVLNAAYNSGMDIVMKYDIVIGEGIAYHVIARLGLAITDSDGSISYIFTTSTMQSGVAQQIELYPGENDIFTVTIREE